MPPFYRPRLSIDLTQEQRDELDNILGQYGLQRAVFSIIIDDLITSVHSHGPQVIAGLISRAIKLEDILQENSNDKHRRSEQVHNRNA